MEIKKCNKCKQIKSLKEFYTQKRPSRNGKVYYGYRYICKPCEYKVTLERRTVPGFKQSKGWKREKIRQGPGSTHRKLSKKNSQKHRDIMSDMYIRSLMTKKSKTLKPEDIPKKLINMHRISLKLKRELREITRKERDE